MPQSASALNILEDKPIARRKRALALAQLPSLGDLSRHFAPAKQRSLIGARRPPGISDDTKRVLDTGIKAVEKIKNEGVDAELTPTEAVGLESLIMVYDRPALLVQHDSFADAAAPWTQLNDGRDAISHRLPKVGRVEVWIGSTVREVATGFLVGDGLVITNRHVVEAIAVPSNPVDNNPTQWQLRKNLRPQINFSGEYMATDSSRVFRFTGHPVYTHPNFDLGLLRIEKVSISDPPLELPTTLALSAKVPENAKTIYAVGYPASDNQNVIPKSVLDDIFGGIFEVKRLSPGEIAADLRDQGMFAHDCSTLGGNSGSCIVDIETELVIGLHFQGSYLKANYAVWLPCLHDYLVERGVQFD